VTKVIFILLVASLAANLVPMVNVGVVLALIPLYWFGRLKTPVASEGLGSNPGFWVKAAYLYWISSFFLFTHSVETFFSFDFLRRDGAILFAYLPLLLLGDYGLDAAFVRRLIHLFLWIMSAIAFFGTVQFADAIGAAPGLASLIPFPVDLGQQSSLAGYIFYGLFQAHNSAGAAYAIAALLALGLLVFSEELPRVFSLRSLWLAMTVIGLGMSKSRGAYVAFAIASILGFFGKHRDIRRAAKPLAAVLLPLLIVLLLQPEIAGRVNTIGSGEEDPNVIERFEYASRALGYIGDSPIFGIGFGRFNDGGLQFWGAPGVFYPAIGGVIVNDDKHAHNSYLHFWAEGGVVGLALMMGIWISVFRWSRDAQRRAPAAGLTQVLARVIQATVIVEFFLSLTEHQMNSAATTVPIFTFCGLLQNLLPNLASAHVGEDGGHGVLPSTAAAAGEFA
jgi:O-antigen ligase